MNENLPIIEMVLYFATILVSPVIYILYLKQNKKIKKAEIRQNMLIFGFFYILIALVAMFAVLKN